MLNYTQKNRGFTLLELLLVIALVTALTAVSLAAWNNINKQVMLQKAQAQVNIIVDAARAWHTTHTSYKTITKSELCDSKLLPNDICCASPNPWGGDYVVAMAKNNDINFTVTITNSTSPEALREILIKNTVDQNSVIIKDSKQGGGYDVIATYD